MEHDNLMLYVASYDDATAAKDDFEALEDARAVDLEIVGAVVLSRAEDGDVEVREAGDGDVAGGAAIGAVGGLVVGLFAPPLLLSTAIGAGIGAAIGGLVKKHEEKELGVELDEYFPANSSAVVVVIDNKYLDRVESALTRSDKRITKAIDSGDYEKLKKAVDKSAGDVGNAVDS